MIYSIRNMLSFTHVDITLVGNTLKKMKLLIVCLRRHAEDCAQEFNYASDIQSVTTLPAGVSSALHGASRARSLT